jgi:nucleotide-binding universal stress UspA family protein
VVIGLDGSAHSRRAVAFLTGLEAPRGARVTCVRVVEPARMPSMGLLPGGIRGRLAAQAAALEAGARRVAERDVEAAARRLGRAGWRARAEVRLGIPLTELLAAVKASRADLLVLGARGIGGVARLLLGSVADAAARRAPVSVLIVR